MTDLPREPLTLLLAGRTPATPEFMDQIQDIAGAVEFMTPEQLRAEPDRVERLDIVYGGLPRELWRRAKQLRWLQTLGAGVNGLLTPEVIAHPVVITTTRGMHAESVTEHLFGMLLTLTRRLDQAWEGQRRRDWRAGRPEEERLIPLAGKTLGILGLGAIGRHAARVGRAFGMRVIGLRRSGAATPEVDRIYRPEEKAAFLAECDVLFNLLPLTAETRHFLAADALAQMKPTAILVNGGRGGTVDTAALVDALASGRLGGACLDVTDPEPLPPDHPLWGMERVLITPHYGGAQAGYEERARRIFLENLRRFVAGEPLLNVVDKTRGY